MRFFCSSWEPQERGTDSCISLVSENFYRVCLCISYARCLPGYWFETWELPALHPSVHQVIKRQFSVGRRAYYAFAVAAAINSPNKHVSKTQKACEEWLVSQHRKELPPDGICTSKNELLDQSYEEMAGYKKFFSKRFTAVKDAWRWRGWLRSTYFLQRQ